MVAAAALALAAAMRTHLVVGVIHGYNTPKPCMAWCSLGVSLRSMRKHMDRAYGQIDKLLRDQSNYVT